MVYKTYNPANQEINLPDLQDKRPWCLTGTSYEEAFVKKYLGFVINLEKKTNIYASNLLNKASVAPMVGVWKITYDNLLAVIEAAPLHTYQQRYNDQAGNTRDSYMLNLNSGHFERVG